MKSVFVLLSLIFALAGCDRGPNPGTPPDESAVVATPDFEENGRKIVFLGDSLTAGLGVEEEQAFPHLVGELLSADEQGVRIVNAGVSGDTTAGGLSRVGWLLRQSPEILVVCLGAGDITAWAHALPSQLEALAK